MSPETSRKLRAFVILAMLSVSEGRRVSTSSATFVNTDLTQMVGNPKLQEEFSGLTGEMRAMMADPFLQYQATLVAEQLEQMGQVKELVTQMQEMMTDPRLLAEAERMRTNGKLPDHEKTPAERAEAMEAIMTNPILQEPVTRLVKQAQAMMDDKTFQDQAARIVQLMMTFPADAPFQTQAKRMAAHMEALKAHETSQKTDDGRTPDVLSLAEVNRSRSGVSFLPPSLGATRAAPFAGASPLAALQGPRSQVRMSEPRGRSFFNSDDKPKFVREAGPPALVPRAMLREMAPGVPKVPLATAVSDLGIAYAALSEAFPLPSKASGLKPRDALNKVAAALAAAGVLFHSEAAMALGLPSAMEQMSATLAGVVAVDGGTVGLDVQFGAFLAVILGTFIPVVFLVTTFIQSDAQGTATTFRQPDSIGGTRFEDE